jgi:hypothetical protein
VERERCAFGRFLPGQHRTCQILWQGSAWESPRLFRGAQCESGEFFQLSSLLVVLVRYRFPLHVSGGPRDIPATRSAMKMERTLFHGSPERLPLAVPAVRELTRRSPRGLPLNCSQDKSDSCHSAIKKNGGQVRVVKLWAHFAEERPQGPPQPPVPRWVTSTGSPRPS